MVKEAKYAPTTKPTPPTPPTPPTDISTVTLVPTQPSTTTAPKPVKISVYYESLCPHGVKYVSNYY